MDPSGSRSSTKAIVGEQCRWHKSVPCTPWSWVHNIVSARNYFDSGAWRIPRTFQETAGWWITLNPEWLLFISPLLAIVDMRPAYDICYKMTWLRYKTALLGTNISLLKTLSSRWFSFSQDGICSFLEGIYYNRFTVVTPETYKSFRKTSSWHIWEQADRPSDKLISTWFTLKSVN